MGNICKPSQKKGGKPKIATSNNEKKFGSGSERHQMHAISAFSFHYGKQRQYRLFFHIETEEK